MKENRLRILLLSDCTSFHTERFLAELRRQGCRVLPASLEYGQVRHIHLKRRLGIRPLYYLLSVSEIRRIIDRFRPDVINPHFASGYGFAAALAARGRSVPVVLNLWGSDVLIAPQRSPLHKLRARLALRKADLVVGDSQYLVTAAERLAPLARSEVIPWGIELRFLSLHKSGYSFQKPLRIIVPRRHEKVYNNVFVLRSLAPLVEQGKVRVTFPAFGSLSQAFRRLAEGLLASGVQFYEAMSREQFLQLMAEHDVYLSASGSDSSPASLIEAMALGLIPVAADIPGVREWLNHESGRLFRQNDESDLRECIIQLLHADDTLSTLRLRNLERVRREAIFEDNVATQIRLMKELL
ncbi:MAG TPA: glycosyltransferase [Candidatus Deferrimicrobium sp.]|nr:glycosyltransferase [Candidatus Deferrimicrobium sp.]